MLLPYSISSGARGSHAGFLPSYTTTKLALYNTIVVIITLINLSDQLFIQPLNQSNTHTHTHRYRRDTFPIAMILFVGIISRIIFLVFGKALKAAHTSSVVLGLCVKHDKWGGKIDTSDMGCLDKFGAFLTEIFKESNSTHTAQDSISRSISYPRAVQRNLIKGLATYNILHNPV